MNNKGLALPAFVWLIIWIAVVIIIGMAIKLNISTVFGSFGFGR